MVNPYRTKLSGEVELGETFVPSGKVTDPLGKADCVEF
jgi:hypothetical protein